MVLSSANAGTQAAIKAGKALVDDCKANSSCDRIAPSMTTGRASSSPHERAPRRVARVHHRLEPPHRGVKPFQPQVWQVPQLSKQSNSKALNAACSKPGSRGLKGLSVGVKQGGWASRRAGQAHDQFVEVKPGSKAGPPGHAGPPAHSACLSNQTSASAVRRAPKATCKR